MRNICFSENEFSFLQIFRGPMHEGFANRAGRLQGWLAGPLPRGASQQNGKRLRLS